MTTKEYLSQVRKLDKKIEKELAELDYYKNLAKGISSITPTNVRVKSSGDKDVLSSRVIKIVELEQKIDGLIDNYVEKRRIILEQINSLENEIEREVLYLKFYKGKTINEIGTDIGYSRTSVYNIYSSGLINFEQKYLKEYKKIWF